MKTRKLTLTVEEAAELLGIGRGTAYQAVHSGQLPHFRIGKRIIIPLAALELILDKTVDVEGRVLD